MAPRRVNEAEQDARRRERRRRSFSDAAYRHYNPGLEGFGSVDEWMRKADAILTGRGLKAAFDTAGTQLQRDLRALHLDAMPGSATDLKRAFRNTLFVVHPDYGGTSAATQAAIEAFERLARHV